MAEKKEKRARTREEAGLVEKNFEQMPNSEAIANKEHIDLDAIQEAKEDAAALGQAHASVISSNPSESFNPYVSQEEQFMEMTPKVFGPPAYGSPDPLTAAGRLVPIEEHPLTADKVGDLTTISDDYANDVTGKNLAPGEGAHPGGPQGSDLDVDTAGGREQREGAPDSYEDMSKDELLSLASDREISGRSSMNKEELVEAHSAYDDASDSDNDEA